MSIAIERSKAGNLPVEIMESIKRVVNIKTAKVLGTKIPESIMIRTDEVIR